MSSIGFDTKSYVESDMDTDTESNVDTDTDGEPDTESNTDSDVEFESEVESEVESESRCPFYLRMYHLAQMSLSHTPVSERETNKALAPLSSPCSQELLSLNRAVQALWKNPKDRTADDSLLIQFQKRVLSFEILLPALFVVWVVHLKNKENEPVASLHQKLVNELDDQEKADWDQEIMGCDEVH